MTKPAAKTEVATAVHSWADLLAEGMRFGVLQFQETLDLQKALLECRNPTDLLRAQMTYLQKTIDHFPAGMGGLTGAPFKAAMVQIEKSLAEHARRYDDVPV